MPHPSDLSLHHARIDDDEAELLSAMAHPVRVRILHQLVDAAAEVETVAKRLGLPAATVTEHLHLLWHARILKTEVADGTRRYRVADPRLGEALTRLRSFTEDDGPFPAG